VIGELVGSYPGISDPDVANHVSHVLHAIAIELGNGRSLPIELRRAVRGLADALRRQMQPRSLRGERREPRILLRRDNTRNPLMLRTCTAIGAVHTRISTAPKFDSAGRP
jgi:hypothetical protein